MTESISYGHSPAANPASPRRRRPPLICPKPTEPPSGMLRCRDSQLRRGPRATRYPKATRQNQCCIPAQHPESPLRIRSGADHPDPPRATQPPDSRSATRAIPTLMGGAPAPDTKELLVVAILHSLPYPRSVPRFQSPHRRRQPPRRSRRSGRWEGSVRDSGPGAHEPLVSIHPASCAASQGACDFQADSRTVHLKCSMRSRIYCSPTRCLGACGTAARRLRSSEATPGDPSSNTPHLRPFSRAKE